MDTGQRSTVGREVCQLELAACCRLRLVQSCLLEEDLLGGDWYRVVETSTAAAGKRRLLLVLPLQLRKGVAEEHLLSLLPWKKKTPGAAATSYTPFFFTVTVFPQSTISSISSSLSSWKLLFDI